MTQGALANSIRLALEVAPPISATRSKLARSILKFGLTDGEDAHAIASAMIAVREGGNDVLWPAQAGAAGATEVPS